MSDVATEVKPIGDGRSARADRTRAAILTACREKMRAGDFRPSVAAVASAARVSVRSVFEHFHNVESMHRAALDADTFDAIDLMIVSARVYAAVFGRLPDYAKRRELAGGSAL